MDGAIGVEEKQDTDKIVENGCEERSERDTGSGRDN